jgi:peptidoglycan/xylan/chitin deacetylase (PgdA/CDA1 family)
MSEIEYAKHWKQAAPLPFGFAGKSRAFFRNALLTAISVANRSLEEKFVRCLFCHYVFDDQKARFERIIMKLKDTGQFIDTHTCIQMLQGKKKIDRRYYHLSFDDGFRNLFTNALPILRKHEVPAIFFVPSSLIEASWEKTQKYCLESTGYNSTIEMFRWNDLKEIMSLGYEVGSHTKTHARFSDISHKAALLEDEILGSKIDIEAKLGNECKYISWPYGRLTDADDESLKTAKGAGYCACFGAYRGTILPGRTDLFSIPRHHFEVQWPISHIEYFARGNMEITS